MFKFHETSHPLRNGDQNFMGCKVKFRLIVINSWDDHGYTMVYKHEVFVITLSPLKIPTWFTFFRRERLKKSVTWQRQPMGGDGETNVLHTQTPWEVFKHQRLVKKRMQHNAAETHISHSKQVSNNVSMYHHYRCYNCGIMIASHLKHQRHVDVEKTPLSRQPLIWQCLTFNLVPKVPVICPPDNKIWQLFLWLSGCHIFED